MVWQDPAPCSSGGQDATIVSPVSSAFDTCVEVSSHADEHGDLVLGLCGEEPQLPSVQHNTANGGDVVDVANSIYALPDDDGGADDGGASSASFAYDSLAQNLCLDYESSLPPLISSQPVKPSISPVSTVWIPHLGNMCDDCSPFDVMQDIMLTPARQAITVGSQPLFCGASTEDDVLFGSVATATIGDYMFDLSSPSPTVSESELDLGDLSSFAMDSSSTVSSTRPLKPAVPRRRPSVGGVVKKTKESPKAKEVKKQLDCNARTVAIAVARSNSPVDDGEDDTVKRASANVLERQRRTDLKYCFHRLRDVVPSIQSNERIPMGQIIKVAASFIQDLNREEKRLEKDISRMTTENDCLRQRLLSAAGTGRIRDANQRAPAWPKASPLVTSC